MYVPDHFRPTDADVRALLANIGAADLITATDQGILGTMLPLIFEAPETRTEAEAHGRLLGHVARNNRQWRVPPIGEARAIVRGLTARQEAARSEPWSVDDAPVPYLLGQLRAMVGVELVINRIEAKFKLSQNRSLEDVDGAIAGLEAEQPGAEPIVDAMR